MKTNKIFLLFFTIFLFSCGQNSDTQNTPTEKQIFSVKTQQLSDFETDISEEKTAVIQGNSTISLVAESSGKIGKIFAKEWENLKAGAVIATISDTVGNYDLALKQAKNNLSLQKANNESQMVNLENAISSAQMQYDKALLAYNQLLGQNTLKYDNLVEKNKNTISGFDDIYRNHLKTLDSIMTQYLYSADMILGKTDNFRYQNDAWEYYLGWNGNGTKDAEDAWDNLYTARGKVRARLENSAIFGENNSEADFALLDESFEKTRKLVDEMLTMIQNNDFSPGLTPTLNNSWLQQWSGYKTSLSGTENGYINWKNQTKVFLKNYKNEELATKLATSNASISAEDFNALQSNSELKLAYDNADLTTTQAIENAKISLEQAKTALENAKRAKEATQNQQNFSLQNANLAIVQAERNASKLSVKTPISGTITKILAEVGQNVNNGTLVAEFVSSEAEAVIEIDPRIALFLEVWQEISAKIDNEKITGTISAISKIANANMLSTVRISFKNAEKFIGQAAVITFSLPENISKSFLIPISAVKIISEGQGEIQILENEKILSKSVRLGAMFGTSIEVFAELPKETSVIVSDVSQFNSEKQKIVIEKISHNQ